MKKRKARKQSDLFDYRDPVGSDVSVHRVEEADLDPTGNTFRTDRSYLFKLWRDLDTDAV